jgi:hypothetical protein
MPDPISDGFFTTPYPPAPSICLAYPKFGDWIRLYDENKKFDFREDRDLYHQMRLDHEADVKQTLDRICERSTGKAVIAEMKSRPSVLIFPFNFIPPNLRRKKTGAATLPAPGAGLEPVSKGRLEGMAICGKTVDGEHVCFTATGGGTNVHMYFTRFVFLRSLDTPDEALLHELVHASRYTRGVTVKIPIHGDGYPDVEEFLAVVISNMYRSERTPERLHDYVGRSFDGAKFLDTDLNPNPIMSLHWLKKQPTLWEALKRVDAPFNPVRQMEAMRVAEERRVERLPL